MTKEEFIKQFKDFHEKSGIHSSDYGITIGDRPEINTLLYIDTEGVLWLSKIDSIKRVKTSININSVTEFRYSEFGEGDNRFFIICSDDSGLDFWDEDIGFIENGDLSHWENAFEYFEAHPVQ